jgi:hypothetical protein
LPEVGFKIPFILSRIIFIIEDGIFQLELL